MTPEELAKSELDKLRKSGKLTFPIDPFKILHDAGIFVVLKDFENLDGIIINDEDNCTVVGINSNNNWQRQRFTAAHEYCHFIKDLNIEIGTTDCIECLKKSNKNIERYANDFAGYLLMPTDELRVVCEQYKNNNGFVDFESITIIAEYFGVSFNSCLNRIAYGLNLIDGDISAVSLRQRMRKYRVSAKREELIDNRIDSTLLSNVLSSMSFIMTDINKYTGQKFLQNYIYNDNKLEGVIIDRNRLNYILADLNFNGADSQFFESDSEEIVMTLGNLELQQYVINTSDEISLKKCGRLHSLLYKYVPYPDDNGKYRDGTALIKRGTIQPVPYYEINDRINELDEELQFFMKKIDQYEIGEYIEQVAYFTYKFIVIHPFRDGNGRISRAIMNWLLSKKNIPPIYIDQKCREEYYAALSKIDLEEDPVPFIMFIEKRIIHTMINLHRYLFVDEIDEEEIYEEAEVNDN
ncbi:MAG: Fic family protein, partial [Bacilli bacterium]|nr:Fic family protein [Bacilli bacterium]